MAEYSKLLSTSFMDTDFLDSKMCLEHWRKYLDGIFDVARYENRSQKFTASARSFQLPGAVLSEYSLAGNVIRREVRSGDSEDKELLVIVLFRSGSSRCLIGSSDLSLDPDYITVFNFHQSFLAVMDDVSYGSITLPHSEVGYDPAVHPQFFQIDVNEPAGRMLKCNLELALELAPRSSGSEGRALSLAISGLLAGFLVRLGRRKDTDVSEFVRARELAVKRFVDEHARDSALSSSLIQKNFGISRAVLYRIFEADGGVQRAIQGRRLDFALNDLVNAVDKRRGIIGEVAARWGFLDQGHFNRLFKKRFGFRPSDAFDLQYKSEVSPNGLIGLSADKRKSLLQLYPKIGVV